MNIGILNETDFFVKRTFVQQKLFELIQHSIQSCLHLLCVLIISGSVKVAV